MSAFRFRLESLLRLRLADRDQRRADLAKAQRAEEALVAQGAVLEREQGANQVLSRRWSSPGAADVDRLIAAHRYELVLRTGLQQLAAQIVQVRGEVGRRRQALVEADRQVRVLEKLCERQQLAHQLREEKREQKELDERAILNFCRREATP